MPDLRFRVGAALDASWDVVFGSALSKAKKARAAIAGEMNAGAKAMSGPYRTAAADVGDALSKAGKAGGAAGSVIGRSADGMREKFAAVSKEVKRLPVDLAIAARVAERELTRIQSVRAKEALGLGGGGRGGGPNMGYRMGYWTSRNFSAVTPTLNMGANIARDIARGAGVDLSLESQIAKSTERQDLATRLSIQGYKSYKAGTGDPNGTKVSAATLTSEAFAHGNAVGMDPNQILAAQTKFVDLTGDLDTARGVMTELGKVSNATGTDMTETATAAAGISKSLETTFGADTQGRIKATKDILLQLAGQGKEGAVELKNYASQMSKVAAAVNEVGGDRKEAFNLIGIMVQQSRAHGGSNTPTQAATSVAAFVRDVTKDAASKHPQLGFISDLFNKDAQGHRTSLKAPTDIIKAAVFSAHGDPVALRKMFPNSMSYRAVEGFAATYRDAERKAPGTGRAALEEEMNTLHQAAVSEADTRAANTETLNETKKKAQLFNNALGEITDRMMAKVVPNLEESGNSLVTAAGYMADFVGWASGHPWEGVGVALLASMSKAGIEQSVRVGVEKMFSSSLGTLGGLSVGAIALTAAYVSMRAEADTRDDAKDTGNDISANNAIRALKHRAPGTATDAEIAAAKAAEVSLGKTVTRDEETYNNENFKGIENTLGIIQEGLGAPWAEGSGKAYHEQIQLQKQHLQALRDLHTLIESRGGLSPPARVDGGVRVGVGAGVLSERGIPYR